MENDGLVFTQERVVSSAYIDSSVKLGIAQAVLMVQDNLTECFGMIGCDGIVYREKYGAFWVFTKTKVRFARRPGWRERITATTFPAGNAGLKAHVNTRFADADGNTLLTANQEACVLDLERHRPVKLSAVPPYPLDSFPAPVFTEPFERFPAATDFSDADLRYEHVIRSQQIDMSRHLNNIEYIKLALNVFTDDFLQSHDPSALEVHYTGESTEGQTLRIFAKERNGATFVHITESGRSVFEMKIVF